MFDNNKQRVCIFIDGSNLYHNLKNFGKPRIDFQKLVTRLVNGRQLVCVFYHNAPLDITFNPEKYWKQQKFFDELRKIPFFKVVLCKMRKYKKGGKIGAYEVKGDDVHLTVDLISGTYENNYDTAVIVSGDEDFVPALKKVQELGKRVENAYFIASASSALKRASDFSICMNHIVKEFI